MRVVIVVHHDLAGGEPSAAGEEVDRSEDDGELSGLASAVHPAVGRGHELRVGEHGRSAYRGAPVGQTNH